MEIKIAVFGKGRTPTKGTTKGSAGWDIYSPEEFFIPAMSTQKIGLNIRMECPSGHFALIKDRSSLASQGLTVVGGVIDGDYRGELIICLRNNNNNSKAFPITEGQRIGQIIFLPILNAVIVPSDSLSSTQRGSGGFGSTGV